MEYIQIQETNAVKLSWTAIVEKQGTLKLRREHYCTNFKCRAGARRSVTAVTRRTASDT